MRKLLVVLTLLAFMSPATLVFSRDPQRETELLPKIQCCFPEGKCVEMSKKDCALKKGKVVTECADCPGVWGKGK